MNFNFTSIITIFVVVILNLFCNNSDAAQRFRKISSDAKLPTNGDPDYTARLSCPAPTSSQSDIVKFSTSTTHLNVEFNEELRLASVKIAGQVTKQNHNLLWKNNEIPLVLSPKLELQFQLNVALTGFETPLTLTIINPYGLIDEKKCSIYFYGWDAWKTFRDSTGFMKPPPWNASLGISMISYKETAVADLSEIGITVKAGYNQPLNEKWSAAVGGYFTALPISSSDPNQSLRFFGLNARIGYRIPWVKGSWGLSIMGGAYYTTTFSSPSGAFGFSNMAGPQIFPVLTKSISRMNSMSMYFKYSSVAQGPTLTSLGSEVAGGIGYTHRVNRKNTIIFGLDVAQLNMNIEDVLQISSRSISFSIGYGF